MDRRAERMRACEILRIGLETPLICAVGSLIPCKGYDTLIAAADELRRRIGDFRLVVCGEGAMRPQLQKMIDERKLNQQVMLLGFCEDPTAWIASADVFVHPTRSEGLSLVSIAAQMVGTPIVASEVGGLREVLRCQYTSRPLGWIYATESPFDLAELLDNALHDVERRRQFINDARQSAMRHFTLDQMVNGFLQLYRNSAADSASTKRHRWAHSA
jgi:glycosyltransferase involved in cell wall biosynthesis